MFLFLKLEHGKTVWLITGKKFYSSHKLLFNLQNWILHTSQYSILKFKTVHYL